MDGTDMLRMMQQAFELSKAFGGGSDTDNNSDNNFERAAGMLRMFIGGQSYHDRQRTGEDSRKHGLESIKTAIPYIDRRYQRYIGVLVKLIEIQSMIEMYGSATRSMFQGTGVEWRRDMLESLKPHIEHDKAVMVDFLIAVIDVSETIRRMNQSSFAPMTDLI